MLNKNTFEKRTAAGTAVVTLHNVWEMVKFPSILCMVLALIIGCRTRNPNAADETNMALILAGEFQMGNNGAR